MAEGKGWIEIRMVKCGKPNCSTCQGGQGHGPYKYLVWRDKAGVRRARYLGLVGQRLEPVRVEVAVE